MPKPCRITTLHVGEIIPVTPFFPHETTPFTTRMHGFVIIFTTVFARKTLPGMPITTKGATMADTAAEYDETEVPPIDETLEVLLLQSIDEAQQRMEQGQEIVPFTSILNGETVTEETHTGETDECLASARATVRGFEGAIAYTLCYDGYIETDDGRKDAIIAEGAMAAGGEGVAVGLIYEEGDDVLTFDEEVVYIDEAPNFFIDEDEPAEGEAE